MTVQHVALETRRGDVESEVRFWGLLGFARVLCVGDYLSPVEIPWLQEHGDRAAYLATLRRLQPYVEQADWVVPGHGAPLDAQRALAILREDVKYLESLDASAPERAALPLARRDRVQQQIHADNLQRL